MIQSISAKVQAVLTENLKSIPVADLENLEGRF